LGPSRFAHIETCAREVCRVFKRQDEVDDCISTLSTLDDILKDLRADLSRRSNSDTPASTKRPNYSTSPTDANISKLTRLISAREKSISAVKSLIARKQTEPQTEQS